MSRRVNNPSRRASQARPRRFDTARAAAKLAPMSKAKLRQKTEKKKGGLRIPAKYTTWLVVGVVGAVVAYLLVSSLSRPPAKPGPVPLLSTVSQDLVSITRMLGDVALDSTFQASLPPDAAPEFATVDSLLRQRSFDGALRRLQAIGRKRAPGLAGPLHAYLGLTRHYSGNPDHALEAFRTAADSAEGALAPWAEFAAGYLFQSRGFQDSAIAWYGRALARLDSLSPLAPVVQNNVGVAWETLKDIDQARTHLEAAVALFDTLDTTRAARVVRDNLRRLPEAAPDTLAP